MEQGINGYLAFVKPVFDSLHHTDQGWGHASANPVLGRQRQKDPNLKVILIME